MTRKAKLENIKYTRLINQAKILEQKQKDNMKLQQDQVKILQHKKQEKEAAANKVRKQMAQRQKEQ